MHNLCERKMKMYKNLVNACRPLPQNEDNFEPSGELLTDTLNPSFNEKKKTNDANGTYFL